MKNYTFKLAALFFFIGLFSLSSLDAQNMEDHPLIQIIKEYQELHVKKSYNQNNCFTNRDLEAFIAQKVPKQVTDELQDDLAFSKMVESLRALSPEKQSNLLAKAKKTYKKTWGEVNQMTPLAQTDAGQSAEKRISFAIVRLVNNMLTNG